MDEIDARPTKKPEERAYEYFDTLIELTASVCTQMEDEHKASVEEDDMLALRKAYKMLRLVAGSLDKPKEYPLQLSSDEQKAIDVIVGYLNALKNANFYTIGYKRAKLLTLHRERIETLHV